MSRGLVLSLFPGLGLLDLAFEQEGWCVVRGPDLLWGGDIRTFQPPTGRFDGVIGGPPCKRFSPLANIVKARYGQSALAPDLIPEFCRVVELVRPAWFLMENVQRAPVPSVTDYTVDAVLVNNRTVGGVQNRLRRFSFGTIEGRKLQLEQHPEPVEYRHAVTTNSGGRRKHPVRLANGRMVGKQGGADDARLAYRPVEDMADDQAIPADWLACLKKHGAFKTGALRTGIGNGVPLTMGRAIARAIANA